MSQSADAMELKEDEIKAHYVPAAEMLMQLDHTPRLAQARLSLEAPEKSPDVAATRRRFRSTTPGLLTRSTALSSGVRLLDRIAESDDDDPLTSPAQAAVAHALRRALSVALALGEAYAEQTPLKELKKLNLEGRLPSARSNEFSDLLAAEALVALYAFGNAASYLLSSHSGEATVDIGSVDEVLTDNA
ncbi:MAG: AAA family ATPase, partial [Pseudomonadota bacterium]